MKDIPEVDDRYLYCNRTRNEDYLSEMYQLLLKLQKDVDEIKDIIIASKKEQDNPLGSYMDKLIKKIGGDN